MTSVVASAADARYGWWLLNLIGSIQRRSYIFDELIVYDLGLSRIQRHLVSATEGIEIRSVPAFVPHWRQGRTWKTWIWRHLEADTVVWLDAGITVLQPMTDFLSQVDENGYFVISQGIPNRDCIPSDFRTLYGVTPDLENHMNIAAGILAFARDSRFFDQVIVPTYEDAVQGRSLGFSTTDVMRLNRGLDRMDPPIVRDCPTFRHEQTLLSIHFYRAIDRPYVNDLYKYAGFRSPRDHPEQVIWSHRRRGDYRFLPRVRYRGAARFTGCTLGTLMYLRRQARQLAWLARPSIYARILGRLIRTGQLRSPRSGRRPSSPM